MLMLDYNHTWYTKDFHDPNPASGTGIQNKIDNLLTYIDYICYLYAMKIISGNEFNVLRYKINRICISPSVKKYLWNLQQFSMENETNCSYMHIIDYGIENGFLEEDFKTNSNLYEKYYEELMLYRKNKVSISRD